MGTKTLIDEAIRHQVYLERFASGVTVDAVKSVAFMARSTERILDDLDGDVGDLDTEELAHLLEEARQKNLEIMVRGLARMTDKFAKLAEFETEYTANQLRIATRRVKVATEKAEVVYAEALARPIPANGKLLESFTKKWTENQVEAVNDVISKGFVNGATNDQIKRAIRGTKKAGYTDGLVESLGRSTEAVVRTSVQHVANSARDLMWAKNADIVEKEKVVVTLDSKTTTVCKSLDGKEFPLGKGPVFPIHVNCRTTKVAVLVEKYAFLSEGRTRSAEFGSVPASQSYYDWLKDQSAEFQDDAIGPVRAKLFRDGGLSADEFSRLNIGRNFEPMTLDEMRRKAPAAFKEAGL